MNALTLLLEKVKSGELSVEEAGRQIEALYPSNSNASVSNAQNSQIDDYEFNMHRHWKSEESQNDDGGVIRHFKD